MSDLIVRHNNSSNAPCPVCGDSSRKNKCITYVTGSQSTLCHSKSPSPPADWSEGKTGPFYRTFTPPRGDMNPGASGCFSSTGGGSSGSGASSRRAPNAGDKPKMPMEYVKANLKPLTEREFLALNFNLFGHAFLFDRSEIESVLDVNLVADRENAWRTWTVFFDADAQRNLTGYFLRDFVRSPHPKYGKKSADGSVRSLSITKTFDPSKPAWLLEGATSSLAGGLIKLNCFGTPGVGNRSDLVSEMLPDKSTEIIIPWENDQKEDGRWPGRDGAQKMARELYARGHRNIWFCFFPPKLPSRYAAEDETESAEKPAKDVRELLKSYSNKIFAKEITLDEIRQLLEDQPRWPANLDMTPKALGGDGASLMKADVELIWGPKGEPTTPPIATPVNRVFPESSAAAPSLADPSTPTLPALTHESPGFRCRNPRNMLMRQVIYKKGVPLMNGPKAMVCCVRCNNITTCSDCRNYKLGIIDESIVYRINASARARAGDVSPLFYLYRFENSEHANAILDNIRNKRGGYFRATGRNGVVTILSDRKVRSRHVTPATIAEFSAEDAIKAMQRTVHDDIGNLRFAFTTSRKWKLLERDKDNGRKFKRDPETNLMYEQVKIIDKSSGMVVGKEWKLADGDKFDKVSQVHRDVNLIRQVLSDSGACLHDEIDTDGNIISIGGPPREIIKFNRLSILFDVESVGNFSNLTENLRYGEIILTEEWNLDGGWSIDPDFPEGKPKPTETSGPQVPLLVEW